MIYAIAHGMDTTTQQHLFNVSGLGMEYSAIIQNLVMLGVTPMQVGLEERCEKQPMEQRLDKKEHQRRVVVCV